MYIYSVRNLAFFAVMLSTALVSGAVNIAQRGREVVLSNGIVSASIDVASAEVTSLQFNGHQMVSNTGRHKNVYFSRDGGASYENVTGCVGSITTQNADTIDFCCKHTFDPARKNTAAWNVDVHFVIRSGVSGLYVYTVNSHPASYPSLSVGEWRMVWSPAETPNDFLDTIYIDQARHWQIPAPGDVSQPVNGPKEVTLFTTGSWAGRMDCKYMYAASYTDIGTWGFASSSKHLGEFVVLPSEEFFNDGPNKQDLTAAIGTILLHLNMNHYDGTGFTIPQGKAWTKFYGPWLLYVNDKSTGDECWHDAQARVKTEASQWPYDWIKNPDYPLAHQRGDVTGQLVVHDPLKPQLTAANAWVGLSPPPDKPNGGFQYEATGYQFWTRTDEQGNFNLAHVRPGTYTLYAYTNGIVGQFEKPNVTVTAGGKLALGSINWNVPHPGHEIAWEIGIPDRSAAEFGHGKDYYQPLLYQKLPEEIPEPLDFTIGKSDPATDWFYAQSRHGTEGKGAAQHWRIHFNLDRAPTGPATLTLAIAGADRARIGIEANDAHITSVSPPVEGGNGLVREAVHTKYSVLYVPIAAGHLQAGQNTITLSQESGGDASYVMYDYLNLELP
jgi:rhamnogalacturonan endolyase